MREEEEKEIREAVEQLEEQEKAWGSTKIQAREQELGSTKSRLRKITGKVRSQKRELAPIKGAAGKKLKYEVEQEDWRKEQISSTTTIIPTTTQPSTQPIGEQESSGGAENLPGSRNRMGSPGKGVTNKAKILDFPARPEPLEPAGSSTRAAVPPDLALNGITIEKDIGTEIVREEHSMEPERMEQEHNKMGLSWGSTRLRQLAWSYPSKLNIVFIKVFNIGLNMELNIGLNTGFNIGFNIGVQYWV